MPRDMPVGPSRAKMRREHLQQIVTLMYRSTCLALLHFRHNEPAQDIESPFGLFQV